jgi:hypothetical protein
LGTRTTNTATSGTLATGATGTVNITLAKTSSILSVSSNYPAEVRLYDTAANLTADASRPSTTAPLAGIGLICQNTTTSTPQTIHQSPVSTFVNNDTIVGATGYLSITNKDTISRAITVTIVHLPQE